MSVPRPALEERDRRGSRPGAGAPAAGARSGRVAVAAVCGVLLVVACLGAVAHVLHTGVQVLVVAAALAWLFPLAAVPALVLALVARAWRWVATAVVVLLATSSLYVPLYVAAPVPSGGVTVRVMTQNMRYGEADAGAIVDAVRRDRIDVLVLEEMTPAAVTRLQAAGLSQALPVSFLRARATSTGGGIFSRWPLSGERTYPSFAMAALSAAVRVPDGPPVTVFCVHPSAPFPQPPTASRAELRRIGTLLRDAATGPVVVGGDFNATWDDASFRALLTDGYRDGAEQAGAGVMRTWPADAPVPPLIGIDHVLTRDAVATSLHTVRIGGTDHLGVQATVVTG